MRRKELEHLIRAAAAITAQCEIVIIGSQSILGAIPDAPESLLRSMEADMYPLGHADLADLIDGSIGELSPFEDCFGYYAHGVGAETATLPDGWMDRFVKIQNENTDLKIGYCLEPHDLAASKLVAGREKDKRFVEILLKHKIIDAGILLDRIGLLQVSQAQKATLIRWVSGHGDQPGCSPSPGTGPA